MDAMPLPPSTPVPQLPNGLDKSGGGPFAGLPPAPSGAMPTIPVEKATPGEPGVDSVRAPNDVAEPEPTAADTDTATVPAVTETATIGPVEPAVVMLVEPPGKI